MNLLKLKADLRVDEGLRLKAYPDPISKDGNPITIGYGQTGPGIVKGLVWTKAQAEHALTNKVASIILALDRRIPWFRKMNDVRQGVLAQMAYQMGIDGLLKFHMTLMYARMGFYGLAADQMMKSLWSRQTPGRAKRLAEEMRTGVWK